MTRALISLALVASLSACTGYYITEQVQSEHIAVAEELCANNGGLDTIHAETSYHSATDRPLRSFVYAGCKNGAGFGKTPVVLPNQTLGPAP